MPTYNQAFKDGMEHQLKKDRDLLEVTAHIACLIGQNWDDLYNGDRVETRLQSIEWAKEFLEQYIDDEDEWLTPIEEFVESKVKMVTGFDVKTLSNKDFDKFYSPDLSVMSENFDDGRLETFGNDAIKAKELASTGRLWTAIDGDDGTLYLVSGYHIVNRVYYFVSKEKIKKEHQDAIFVISFNCSCCEDKGYIEVTHDDGEYIEACQECDYFGIIGNDQDDKAKLKAKQDGYKLTKTGKIKG